MMNEIEQNLQRIRNALDRRILVQQVTASEAAIHTSSLQPLFVAASHIVQPRPIPEVTQTVQPVINEDTPNRVSETDVQISVTPSNTSLVPARSDDLWTRILRNLGIRS